MNASRIPDRFEENTLTRRRRELLSAGRSLIDLTVTNPTRVGLPHPQASALVRLAAPEVVDHAPEPRGMRQARESVAGYYADRGDRVDPDDLALVASTSEAYAHLFRLLGSPGDAFLVPEPSYPLFEPLAALVGVRLVPYPLRYDGRWWLDRDRFESTAASDRVRGVVLVEPNNPTGSVLDADESAWLRRSAIARGLPLIVDQVFLDFAAAGVELCSGIDEEAPLRFHLSGLSKVAGTPQLKLGWIAAAGPAAERRGALDRLDWILDAFLSVGAPVQAALPELLRGRGRFLEATRARLDRNERHLDERCAGSGLVRLARQGGWSTIVRLPATRSDEEWCLDLLEAGVVAHPGHFYDLGGMTALVLSLITPEKEWADGLEILLETVGRS